MSCENIATLDAVESRSQVESGSLETPRHNCLHL